jgi:phosphomannomutase
MDEIKHIVLNKKFSPDLYGGKVVTNNQVIKDEVDFALKRINLSQVRKFKVVTDTANGMAILYLDEFFKRVSANVIRIFEEIDGDFPNHEANPLKFETLNWIQEKVIEEEADFGMAFDADGDRIFFIDEKGNIIPATVITSLIARRFLKDKKHETIVVDVRYTRNVSIQVKKLGGEIEFTRVGHAFITEKLAEVNGVFAGESSGHFFFRDTGFAESTVLTIALLFEILSLENKKLSQIVKDVYCYYESGEYNFELPENTDKDQLLKKLVDKYSRGEINWLDGISVDFENWRFNIRSSNTEPLIRLNLEAENETLMKEKLDDLFNFILAFGLKPKK